MAICDPDGVILAWNTASENLYGWSDLEARGRAIDELLETIALEEGEGDASGSRDIVVRRCRDRRQLRIDRLRSACRGSAPGQGRIIETSRPSPDIARPGPTASDTNGRCLRLIEAMTTAVIHVDLDQLLLDLDRRAVADAAGLHAAVDADPTLPLRLLRLAHIEVSNAAATRLLFADRASGATSLAQIWHADSFSDFIAILAGVLDGEDRVCRLLALTTLRGERLDCEASAHASVDAVGERRMALCLTDVTELKRAIMLAEQSREYYQAIFETMPIGLYRIDGSAGASLAMELLAIPDGEREAYLIAHPEIVAEMSSKAIVAEVNRQGAALLRSTKEAIRGRPIKGSWSRRPDTYRRSLAARLRNEFFEEETQVVAHNGEVIDVLFAMAPVAHAGERYTIIGMVDLGALRRAEADLSQVQSDFAHAARIASLGELTASLAHEVSQPLSAIHLCTETAARWLDREAPDVDEARAQLARIKSHAGRATAVIKRVRDMTLVAGSRRQRQNFSEIVADALALVAPQARAMKARIVLGSNEAFLPIVADRIEIEQVIVNLIVNALQAMDLAGSSEREIMVIPGTSDDMVTCAISDTGPGIAGVDLNRLFDRFFTTKPEGMGLGLAICRTIIEAHGGVISVGNRPDRGGALCSLRLPFAADPSITN